MNQKFSSERSSDLLDGLGGVAVVRDVVLEPRTPSTEGVVETEAVRAGSCVVLDLEGVTELEEVAIRSSGG